MVRTSSRRRAVLVALSGVVTATGAPALAGGPAASDRIVASARADSVSIRGYGAYVDQDVQLLVVRDGVEIGRVDGILRAGQTALEVNRPGGLCWDSWTPDLRPGDEVRLLVDGWPADREPDSIVVSDDPRRGTVGAEAGSGVPGCPRVATYRVSSAQPPVLNVAAQGGPMELAGSASHAEAVTVRLEDGHPEHTVTLPARLQGDPGARTWSVTVPPELHGELEQGRLTASAEYQIPVRDPEGQTVLARITGEPLPILKDTVAPPAPVLFPRPRARDGATGLPAPVRVPAGAAITMKASPAPEPVTLHYGTGEVGSADVAPAQAHVGALRLTADTRVAAAAVDAAGNTSAVVAVDYLVRAARPLPPTPVTAPAPARTVVAAPDAPARARAAAPRTRGPVADIRAARLAWTPRGTGVRRYEIQVYRGRTLDRTVAVPGAATSARVVGLAPGTAYRFRVRAVTAAGGGTRSPYTPAVVPAAPPRG